MAMQLFRFTALLITSSLLFGCSASGASPASAAGSPDFQPAPIGPILRNGHAQVAQTLFFNTESEALSLVAERSASTHLDLAWFWKYYPEMLQVKVTAHDSSTHTLTLEVTFTNPLKTVLGDVRAIWPADSDITPRTVDGWTFRAGASHAVPDPFFGFGNSLPLRRFEPGVSDTREAVFTYKSSSALVSTMFVLDAVVNNNTAEPYEFSSPSLTGRFFHIQISDWQEDITGAWLDLRPAGYPARLRLAPFGKGSEWGTSVPDLQPGLYRLLLTAESLESAGEDNEGLPVASAYWVDLKWPPDGPLVPLPRGQGIYCYSMTDPDTNLPPTKPAQIIAKFKNKMGGRWLILEYGEICNSGYLAMHSWTPDYVYWIHWADPQLPIHLCLDNLGFQSIADDPCHHPVENYTQAFFDHLLESIRGQILENPAFDVISGLHFDIEPFPEQYTDDELRAIYRRYADFLARLHMEPALRGRNITIWEFRNPVKTPDKLFQLATCDAFAGGCYYTGFDWQWDPDEYPAPFIHLRKMVGGYSSWAQMYGRPMYPVLETFGGWIDGNKDTLSQITICGSKPEMVIDEYCFGKGPLGTSNEFEVVKAQSIHGMWPEKVVLNLPTGESVFPSSGLAVYRMGDGNPSTVSDDFVYCRTAYAISQARQITLRVPTPFMYGYAVFRFENDHAWKAAAFANPVDRGSITGCSGRIHFSDHLSVQQHPELWGKIVLELVSPLTPEIVDNPVYRKSIDIVGVEDGSYLFPDLPRAVVTIRAVAPGWASEPVTVDLSGHFAYRENVDLLLEPE